MRDAWRNLQGDYIAAIPLVQEALAIFKQLGDKEWVGKSISLFVGAAWTQGDYASARELGEEKLAISRELGDKHAIADSTKFNWRVSLREACDYAVARAL